MGTLEEEIRVHLSRLTHNKIEHDDLYDFGENDGLDDECDNSEGITPLSLFSSPYVSSSSFPLFY